MRQSAQTLTPDNRFRSNQPDDKRPGDNRYGPPNPGDLPAIKQKAAPFLRRRGPPFSYRAEDES